MAHDRSYLIKVAFTFNQISFYTDSEIRADTKAYDYRDRVFDDLDFPGTYNTVDKLTYKGHELDSRLIGSIPEVFLGEEYIVWGTCEPRSRCYEPKEYHLQYFEAEIEQVVDLKNASFPPDRNPDSIEYLVGNNFDDVPNESSGYRYKTFPSYEWVGLYLDDLFVFDEESNFVDFENLTDEQAEAIAADAELHNALSGKDTVLLPSSKDIEVFVDGERHERVYGNEITNESQSYHLFEAEAGDDTVTGRDLSDAISGGPGNDTIFGGPANDWLAGNQFVFLGLNDTYTSSEENRLVGEDGDDQLIGAEGPDTLTGGPGNDTLFAGGGADKLYGGTGMDRLHGGTGVNDVLGGDSIDQAVFSGDGRNYRVILEDVFVDFNTPAVWTVEGPNGPQGTVRQVEEWRFDGGVAKEEDLLQLALNPDEVAEISRELAAGMANIDELSRLKEDLDKAYAQVSQAVADGEIDQIKVGVESVLDVAQSTGIGKAQKALKAYSARAAKTDAQEYAIKHNLKYADSGVGGAETGIGEINAHDDFDVAATTLVVSKIFLSAAAPFNPLAAGGLVLISLFEAGAKITDIQSRINEFQEDLGRLQTEIDRLVSDQASVAEELAADLYEAQELVAWDRGLPCVRVAGVNYDQPCAHKLIRQGQETLGEEVYRLEQNVLQGIDALQAPGSTVTAAGTTLTAPTYARGMSGGTGSFTGTDGADLLMADQGAYSVAAGDGHDVIMIGRDTVTVDAGSGNDTIMTSELATRIDGGEGEDVLDLTSAPGMPLFAGDPEISRVEWVLSDGRYHRVGYDPSASGRAHAQFGDADANTIVSGLAPSFLFGAAGDDTITGGEASDVLAGGSGDDRLVGAGGRDSLYGGVGDDVAVFSGESRDYTITFDAGSHVVRSTAPAGSDQASLISVERVAFDDRTIALDQTPIAFDFSNEAARQDTLSAVYVAYFDRAPDAEGMAFWLQELDAGLASGGAGDEVLVQIANSFAVQPESQAIYPAFRPNATDGAEKFDTFVEGAYENLFNRRPETDGRDYWVNALNEGLEPGNFLVSLMLGARYADAQVILNKIDLSDAFLQAFDGNSESPDFDIDAAQDVFDLVTADPDSVSNGRELIQERVPEAQLSVTGVADSFEVVS